MTFSIFFFFTSMQWLLSSNDGQGESALLLVSPFHSLTFLEYGTFSYCFESKSDKSSLKLYLHFISTDHSRALVGQWSFGGWRLFAGGFSQQALFMGQHAWLPFLSFVFQWYDWPI